MELEDTETFEINDFTNATNWESFISKLEEIFSMLENISLTNENAEKVTVHTIKYTNFSLNVGLYVPKIELINNELVIEENNNYSQYQALIMRKTWECESEFEHYLDWNISKWFGKMKYIAVVPLSGTFIYCYEDVKHILNSITIAISNIKCQLPVIVKHGSRNWPIYDGIMIDNGFKIMLNSAAIKYTPKQCNNLCGVRRVFQQKLGMGMVLDDEIDVTVKYLYRIENYSQNNPKYFSGFINPAKLMNFFQYFSMGFSTDPIKEIRLWAHWPDVPKPTLTQSNKPLLNISSANSWFLSCVVENTFDGIMYRSLRKLLKAFLIIQKPFDILQDHKPQDLDSLQINRALMKLTNSPISNKLFSHPIGAHFIQTSQSISAISLNQSSTNSSNNKPLLDDRTVQNILLFLFPDVPNASQTALFNPYQIPSNVQLPNYEKLLKKYANINIESSLVHRISVCLTNLLNQHKDGLKCVSLIWMEIVLELRYRFENGIPITSTRLDPNYIKLEQMLENKQYVDEENGVYVDELFNDLLEKTSSNVGSSQLEQRIQLINYCILARKRNEFVKQFEQKVKNDALISEDDDDNGDDGGWEDDVEETELNEEFYECKEESPISRGKGQLRPIPNLYQLSNDKINLYVPITQVLPVSLNPTISNNNKYDQDYNNHNASLLSDMSAFKAANPGCSMEDFIRWYSPRDFGTEHARNDEEKLHGSLSVRMRQEGNVWIKNWNEAPIQPVCLQKRLFDETVVVESALKWLQNLTSAELASNIINNVLLDYLAAMVDSLQPSDCVELTSQVDEVARVLLEFLESVDVLDICGAELEYYQSYDDLISRFQKVEYILAVRTSLEVKFNYKQQKLNTDDVKQIKEMIQKLAATNQSVVEINRKTTKQANIEFFFNNLIALKQTSMVRKSVSDNAQPQMSLDAIFGDCDQQEYCLSYTTRQPYSNQGRKSTQRLYAFIGSGINQSNLLSNENTEFRLATVIGEDLTYF